MSTQQLALLESFQKKSINSDQPAYQESIWLTCYSISEKKRFKLSIKNIQGKRCPLSLKILVCEFSIFTSTSLSCNNYLKLVAKSQRSGKKKKWDKSVGNLTTCFQGDVGNLVDPINGEGVGGELLIQSYEWGGRPMILDIPLRAGKVRI